MPKQKKKKLAKKPWEKVFNLHPAFYIVILVALAIGTGLAINPIRDNRNQEQLESNFGKIEQDLRDVSLVTGQALPSLGAAIDKKCYHLSRKFSKEPLYCFIELKTTNRTTRQNLAIVDNSIVNSGAWELKERVETTDSEPAGAQYVHIKSKIICKSSYQRDLGSESDPGYIYLLSCAKESQKPFYPLTSS